MNAAELAERDAARKLAEEMEARAEKERTAVADKKARAMVVVHGRPDGAFSIDGPGLGNSGSLTIGGVTIPTTRWDDRSIRGILPKNARGVIELKLDSGVTRFGVYPAPPPTVVVPPTPVAPAVTDKK